MPHSTEDKMEDVEVPVEEKAEEKAEEKGEDVDMEEANNGSEESKKTEVKPKKEDVKDIFADDEEEDLLGDDADLMDEYVPSLLLLLIPPC